MKKKILNKIQARHVLLGAFLSGIIVIAMAWFLAPVIVDGGLRYLAKEQEANYFEINVERIDPWETRIQNIVFEKEEVKFSVDSLLLQYEPEALAFGRVYSFTLRNLGLNIDGKAMLDHLLEEQQITEPENSNNHWFPKVGEFLSDPKLRYLRFFDSQAEIRWPDFTLPLHFQLKGDYQEGFASTTFDGEFADFPFLSELHFWHEDGNTYADIEIEFSDLNKSGNLKNPISRFTGFDLSNELSIDSGNLLMQGIGRIDGNGMTDLFMEFNGSNISGKVLEFPFLIEKVISFVTPVSMKIVNFQNYLNIEITDFAEFTGLALGIEIKDQNLTIRPSIQKIETADAIGDLKITGLSLPVFDLNLSDLEDLPIQQPQNIFFESLELEEGTISLVDGKVNLLWNQEMNLLRAQVFPLDGIFTDLNIRMSGLSFNGLLNLEEPFSSNFNQVLSCERAYLGEESLVENLTMSFRPLGPKEILIDNFTAKLSGIMTDINPANCTLSILEQTTGGYRIDFNGTEVKLGRDKILLEGLYGSVLIKSFDPILTAEKNVLSFRKFEIDQLQFEDGNFSFSVNEEGEFVISDFFVRVFDGSMEMELAKWKIYTDYIKIESMLKDVSGQQIIDFFEGIDLQIDGNFSGMVSFSNYGGIWDFGTGFLQLNPSDQSHIKFNYGDLIYGGIDPSDPQAKNLKLTAWALEDLKVDGMRVNFKVLENERQIIMSINGVRETEDQKVDLDYKPRFLGGLQDLLKWKENLYLPK